jgi:hypothetical protein
MFARYLLLFAGAVSMAAAQTVPPAPAVSAPQTAVPPLAVSAPQAPAQHASSIRFEDASDKAGINFTSSFGSRQLGSLLEGTGSGCVWLDYNNSGRESLYVVNGRPLDDSMHPYPLKVKPATPPHNHLYRNDGNGHFTDVTEVSGLDPDMYSVAVTAADYDNDGFVDLLVTGYGKTILYHNDGNGHFTDVTAKAGLKVDGWGISSTWLDYDKDGCVDLFVGRYVKFDPKYRAFYAADNYPGPLDYEGETNKLYHNNCDGTFTDVSEKSGIGAFVGRTMGVTAADFDNDGWDDIYVANDRTENFLFHNKHDGTFEEIANETGTAYGQNGESTSSMGPVFADLEGRGMLDLWVTDGHYNRLLHNAMAPTDGSSSEGWKPGKPGFEDMGATNGVSQANAQYVSWGTGVYDFNNDGKIDAFQVNLGGKGTLLHNVYTNTGHWIEIKLNGAMSQLDGVGTKAGLKGTMSNRDGIGARVEVFAGGKRQTAERVAGSGYLSQNDGRLHFGLGAATTVDKLIVHWPSGRVQTIEKPGVDKVLTIEEPKSGDAK